jgi:hypothetical protein
MKTITIRLPAVEAAMLSEVQKRNKEFRSLDSWLASVVRAEYQRAQ